MKALSVPLILLTLLSLPACAPKTQTTGDPIKDFEASCMYAALSKGDYQGADACMDMASKMLARRAARPQPIMPARSVPAPPQPNGSIKWVATTPPSGLNVNVSSDDGGSSVMIEVSGTIVRGDFDKIGTAILYSEKTYPNAKGTVLILNSTGGSIDEATKIARGILSSGVPVVVLPRGKCASACFILLAAARTKMVSRSSRIGVHSAFDATAGAENEEAKAVTTDMARAYAAVGVPPAIIGKMVATPPGQMAWLTESDLRSMGVRFFPPDLEADLTK